MVKEIVAICPRCSEKLIATRLSCNNCELELTGDFHLSKFDYLSDTELEIVECFLRAQGNFKTVQLELEMSYPAIKKKFYDILEKLNLSTIKELEKEDAPMTIINFQPISETDSLVIKIIKEKLNASGGQANVPLYNKDNCDIKYDTTGKGLISTKIPPANQLTWEAFDAAVEVVIKNNGKAEKGKARSGAKLGSDGLSLDSIEGYIAHKVHNVQIGATAFGPGFVIAAVLDWAEICHNQRGYLTINHKFMAKYKD
ncbi:MAG: DUF2089 family protein [Actinomycetota bacterium]